MAEPLLQVEGLSVTFAGSPPVQAVRGIDLRVHAGELVGLVGESGSGKSSTALALMGLLPDTAEVAGSVRFGGQQLLGLDDAAMSRLRGLGLAMVFQDPTAALLPVRTIGAQVVEAVRLHDRAASRRAARARAGELLDLVGIADVPRALDAYVHELSGGMRQRVMIAIAIANQPRLIIADEPTTALDATVAAQVLDLLARARAQTGAAVLLVTHDLAVVAGQADRVAVMYAGRVVEQASATDLFARPRMPYTIGLLRAAPSLAAPRSQRPVAMPGRAPTLTRAPVGCPFVPRCPAAAAQCGPAEPALVRLGTDDRSAACARAVELEDGDLDPEALFPRPSSPAAAPSVGEAAVPLLELDGVHRGYPLLRGGLVRRRVGTVRAVDGVSFTLRRGRTLALVGESGSGKTSTVMQVLELAGAQRGTIRVDGQDTAHLTRAARQQLRQVVQVVFQDPTGSLDPRLDVGRIVAEPLTVRGLGAREQQRGAQAALELVGLDASVASRYPHELSGGQRQRVAIARALVVRPRLVVLDEPVAGLDVSVQAGVINLLLDLRERLGLGLLVVAHDLAVVRQLADDVAVMYLGRVVEAAPVDDLFAAPQHPYTRALLSAVPVPDPVVETRRHRILLAGEPPAGGATGVGCRFAPRCPLRATLPADRRARCDREDPVDRRSGASLLACHWASESPGTDG